MNTSLIEQDARQMRLTTAEMPDALFEPHEAQGDYTAERFFKNKRGEYDIIVRMLAEGLSAISISRVMNCAEKTVARIREREAGTVGQQKERVGAAWRAVTRTALGRIEEKLSDDKAMAKTSVKDLSIVASIGTQNWQLLAGEATQRVEFIEKESDHNSLNDYLKSLKSAGTVIDVPSEPVTTVPIEAPPAVSACNPPPQTVDCTHETS